MEMEKINETLYILKEKNADMLTRMIDETNRDILSFKDEKGQNLLHYAFLLSSYDCAIVLLKNNVSMFEKNDKEKTPFDILYIKYLINKNNLKPEIIYEINLYIEKNKFINMISNQIYEGIQLGSLDYINFLLNFIDIQKTDSVEYFSNEKRCIMSIHFLQLIYRYNNKELFNKFINLNIKHNQILIEELKKTALIEGKYDWIPLLNKKEVFNSNSTEVIKLAEKILCFN